MYSELLNIQTSNKTDGFRGLGYVDSHKDTLEIKFELKNVLPSPPVAAPARNRRHHKSNKPATTSEKTVEIELIQDKTALHSRKGDTGSVLWKARFASVAFKTSIADTYKYDMMISIDFGQLVLQQYYSGAESIILNRENLHNCHILELGFAISSLIKRLNTLTSRVELELVY